MCRSVNCTAMLTCFPSPNTVLEMMDEPKTVLKHNTVLSNERFYKQFYVYCKMTMSYFREPSVAVGGRVMFCWMSEKHLAELYHVFNKVNFL